MRVLVACEESQEVCKAFRALGHEAYSCDIQECSVRTGKCEAKATGGYGLVKLDDGWKFDRSVYYVQSLKDTEHFPVVGYIDINRAMADVILQAISMGAEPPKEET